MKRPILSILCVMTFATLAQADFLTGVEARNRGDYKAAMVELRPLAE
jgi:hypothetical protein